MSVGTSCGGASSGGVSDGWPNTNENVAACVRWCSQKMLSSTTRRWHSRQRAFMQVDVKPNDAAKKRRRRSSRADQRAAQPALPRWQRHKSTVTPLPSRAPGRGWLDRKPGVSSQCPVATGHNDPHFPQSSRCRSMVRSSPSNPVAASFPGWTGSRAEAAVIDGSMLQMQLLFDALCHVHLVILTNNPSTPAP